MANKLAQFGGAGVARAISPMWSMYGGDIAVALSIAEKQAGRQRSGGCGGGKRWLGRAWAR
jgi:L-aminopeptidase/D-esterase-like protein